MSKKKVVLKDPAIFLARVGELLKEGYTFSEAVYLILPHHTVHYEEVIEVVEKAFKQGLGATAVLKRLNFPDTVLLSMTIAERNGRLVDVLENLSIQLQHLEEAKKKLQGLLVYPITLLIFVGGLLVAFRQFFLPNMKALSSSRQQGDSTISDRLPDLVAMLPDMMIGTAIVFLGIIGVGLFYYQRNTPENKIKFIKRLPIIRLWVFQWKSQQFGRELGSLLESGISMQDALDILIEQSVDPLLSEISKGIKAHLIYGEPFHSAVALTDGLTKEFSSFAKHGEVSGHLAKELLIYSKHLEEAMYRKMTKGLSLLQPVLFSLIALCIMAAYIALLLPVYNMLDTI